MKISVYGPGCQRCHETERVVRNVLAELGVDADVEKVGDWKAMVAAGVLATPAVAIDGEIKIRGRIPTPAEVKSLLDRSAAKD